MSNKSIGKAFEKKVRGIMEAEGWQVETANPKLQFIGPGRMISKAHDFFGCIDLIGVHPKAPYTVFVQCTTGAAAPRRKKMEAIKWNYDGHRVVLIKRMPNKRDWTVYTKQNDKDWFAWIVKPADQREGFRV